MKKEFFSLSSFFFLWRWASRQDCTENLCPLALRTFYVSSVDLTRKGRNGDCTQSFFFFGKCGRVLMAGKTQGGKAPFKTGRVFFMYAFWHVVSPVVSFRGRSVVSVRNPNKRLFSWEKTQKNPWSLVGPTKPRGVRGFFCVLFVWEDRIFNIGSGLDYHGRPRPEGV